MHSQPHTPNLRELLREARAKREAFENAPKRHARSYRESQATQAGSGSTVAGRDSVELKDPRRRELCQHELDAAVEIGLIPPQLPPIVVGYGFWGLA